PAAQAQPARQRQPVVARLTLAQGGRGAFQGGQDEGRAGGEQSRSLRDGQFVGRGGWLVRTFRDRRLGAGLARRRRRRAGWDGGAGGAALIVVVGERERNAGAVGARDADVKSPR